MMRLIAFVIMTFFLFAPAHLLAQELAGPEALSTVSGIRVTAPRAFAAASIKSGPEIIIGVSMMIENISDQADRIVSASVPGSDATVHFTTRMDEMGEIIEINQTSIALPPRSNIQISPNGILIMIKNIGIPKPGDKIPLRLALERAGSIDVSVPMIEQADAPQPEQPLLK